MNQTLEKIRIGKSKGTNNLHTNEVEIIKKEMSKIKLNNGIKN